MGGVGRRAQGRPGGREVRGDEERVEVEGLSLSLSLSLLLVRRGGVDYARMSADAFTRGEMACYHQQAIQYLLSSGSVILYSMRRRSQGEDAGQRFLVVDLIDRLFDV